MFLKAEKIYYLEIKKKEIPSEKKQEKKKDKKTIRELIFEEFPHGFYRK